jgi:hypothetical protein
MLQRRYASRDESHTSLCNLDNEPRLDLVLLGREHVIVLASEHARSSSRLALDYFA